MAKEKKPRKPKRKGIEDPRKAERKKSRSEASSKRTERAIADYAGRRAARNVTPKPNESTPVVDTTSAKPVSNVVKPNDTLDANPTGYGERITTPRQKATLDPRDAAEDKATVEAVKRFEAEPPKSNPTVIKTIMEKRRAARAASDASRTNLTEAATVSSVGPVEEPTPAQQRFQETQRGPSTPGNINYGRTATPAPELAPTQSPKRAEQRLQRGMQNPPVARTANEEPKYEIDSVAKRLAASSLFDRGIEPSEDSISRELISNTEHEQKARVMTYTGLSNDEITSYLGKNNREARNRLSNLHAGVMQFQRSRRKLEVHRDMGLEKTAEGSFEPTEAAKTQFWQHPTETDKSGAPKVYRVSDMHPDMVKQLQHPWGGQRTEQEVEGTKGSAASGTVEPVITHYGHHKGGDRNRPTWRFTPPPKGWGEDGSLAGTLKDKETLSKAGITPNVSTLVARVLQGFRGDIDVLKQKGDDSRSSRQRHQDDVTGLLEAAQSSHDEVSGRSSKGFVGKRKVAKGIQKVPGPGFTNVEELVPIPVGRPKKSKDNMFTIKGEGIPAVRDEQGNPKPLPPRAGRRGGTTVVENPVTGESQQRRAVLVTQTGTGGISAEDRRKIFASRRSDEMGTIFRGPGPQTRQLSFDFGVKIQQDAGADRAQAEAASGKPRISGYNNEVKQVSDLNNREEAPTPKEAPKQYMIPFEGKSRQFLGGNIRALTEQEANVETAGANTVRGSNPPRRLFDVGVPEATAARSRQLPPKEGKPPRKTSEKAPKKGQ